MYSLSIKTRISRVLLDWHIMLSAILGLVAMVLSIGFLTSTANDLILLKGIVDFPVWASFFSIYATLKLLGCLYRLFMYIKVFVSTMGLWLWSYLILSYMVFDKGPISPTDLVLITPLICEMWALIIILYNPKSRRATDT